MQANTDVMTVQAVEMTGDEPLSDIRIIFPLLNSVSTSICPSQPFLHCTELFIILLQSTAFYNATCVFWNFSEK